MLNIAPKPKLTKSVWLFPDSDKRLLTSDEVRSLPPEQLWKARNEIFARHGLIFKTERGKQYAQSLGNYYRGVEIDADKVYQQLNNFERHNVEVIKKYEK